MVGFAHAERLVGFNGGVNALGEGRAWGWAGSGAGELWSGLENTRCGRLRGLAGWAVSPWVGVGRKTGGLSGTSPADSLLFPPSRGH